MFVGEALVGNEAVDQLTKFNQALADHSSAANPHLIDGIVLTKFDTIDDKVIFTPMTFRIENANRIRFNLLIGWSGNLYDVHHWTTDCFRWNGSNLHRFESSKC